MQVAYSGVLNRAPESYRNCLFEFVPMRQYSANKAYKKKLREVVGAGGKKALDPRTTELLSTLGEN